MNISHIGPLLSPFDLTDHDAQLVIINHVLACIPPELIIQDRSRALHDAVSSAALEITRKYYLSKKGE